MKRVLFAVLCIAAVLIMSSSERRSRIRAAFPSSLAFAEHKKKTKLEPSPYPLQNHRFCIAVFGENNGAFLEKVLQTVFFQNYENFHVVYIDNASDDGSFGLAQEIAAGASFSKRIDFLKNEHPLSQTELLLQGVSFCEEGDVLVLLPGNDWLAHEWVLQRLNQYYADPDLWVVCARSCDYPGFIPGAIFSFGAQGRKEPAGSSQIKCLKTFRAALLKEGHLYPNNLKSCLGTDAQNPLASLFAEASGHIQFARDILYIVNQERFE